MSCVYKHIFPNGAVYIGRTDMEPEDRFMDGWGYRNMPAVFSVILQYGWKNVKHEILHDNLTKEESKELEKKEIIRSFENEEVILNIHHVPAQYRAHKSTKDGAQYDLITGHRIGHYKEHIIPLVEKPNCIHQCPINVYDIEGNYITTYPSIKITAQELGVNAGNVASCCKGVRSTGKAVYSVGDYVFRYAPEKILEKLN